MMWLVAPPKIICRSLFVVKAPLTKRSQPSALAAARTAFTSAAAFQFNADGLGGNTVIPGQLLAYLVG